jgi:predicted small secreted protein
MLLFLAALVAVAGLGCNTANGFGKDMFPTPARVSRTAPSESRRVVRVPPGRPDLVIKLAGLFLYAHALRSG